MKVQVLVAALNQNPKRLVEEMNISSSAIVVNQCDIFQYEKWEKDGNTIQVYSLPERGVGLSRNHSLMRATEEICLFSDQDIIYSNNYEQLILKEFDNNPKADMFVFNIEVEENRRTYYNTQRKRVRWFNCGRYGAVSFAIRREVLLRSGITFSLLFGGGARYSNGEDSLFIKEMISRGYKVYTAPVTIGMEKPTESTWFCGYDEKFFTDRGILYRYLYGRLAVPMTMRFLMAHKKKMCETISFAEAYKLMRKGSREVKDNR